MSRRPAPRALNGRKVPHTPKKADRLLQTVSLLWNYAALELDWPLGENPAKGIKHFGKQREFEPWPEAARLVKHAQEVVEASERMRGIVDDLRKMGGSSTLAQAIASLADGANVAADAIGKPRLEIPTAPDGLPTSSEISNVMAVFVPGRGFDRSYSLSADGSRAEEFARKLKG